MYVNRYTEMNKEIAYIYIYMYTEREREREREREICIAAIAAIAGTWPVLLEV